MNFFFYLNPIVGQNPTIEIEGLDKNFISKRPSKKNCCIYKNFMDTITNNYDF